MRQTINLLQMLFAVLLLSTSLCRAEPEPLVPPGAANQAAEAERRVLTERILEKTQAARDKLAGKLTNKSTQELQQTVVSDLEKLIESLKTSPPSSENSAPPPDSDSSQSKSKSSDAASEKNQPQNRSKSTGTGTGADRNQPEDSEERHGESQASKLRADRKRRLENDIWGHLPPALREQLLNSYGERMLPQYEDFVKKFYEALSEPSRASKR